ncbi:MAG: TraR/DksA C4-type zinc finger protein [Deltaproteobacteria bacterium]
MLTKKEGQYFRGLLGRVLDELSENRKGLSNAAREQVKMPDLIDVAAGEYGRFLNLRMCERKAGLVRKVEKALQMIEDGSYGICQTCGERIGKERLKARPVTQLCIQCKRRQEKQERLRSL